jgi:hypothetical protein
MIVTRIAGRAGPSCVALLLAACGQDRQSTHRLGWHRRRDGRPAPSTERSRRPSLVRDPSFDVSAIAKGLENVDSYKVAITVNGVEQYKRRRDQPELSRDIMMTAARDRRHRRQAWVATGRTAKAVPSQLATTMFAAFDPTMMVGMFSGPEWAQSSLDKGTEEKNGVSTHHYLIDSTTAVGGFSGVPAGASINLWIADEGYLVALEATGMGGGDVSIQVTDVDDPANKVERPA